MVEPADRGDGAPVPLEESTVRSETRGSPRASRRPLHPWAYFLVKGAATVIGCDRDSEPVRQISTMFKRNILFSSLSPFPWDRV